MTQPESFGRYQLLKRLARGGMGEVWLARQAGMQGFEKLVVIKRILPHLAEDEEFVNMFLDEGKIAAKLNHSNIVNIFDLGQEGEYFFLAMEYLHGEDVRRIWKQAAKAGTALPPALACRIIADACAGLDFAHKRTDERGEPLNIVHRDISPHNIIVTFDGAVKVIDFGIARARGRLAHTATGALKGRFEYMSPEHAAGYDIDHRSDIFALGVVLWESLSGRRLFKRDSETATLLAVAQCQVPPPSELNADIPPELDAVLMKALAPKREDRFEDAAALRLALENWLVEARQPASSAHLGAFMRSLYAERLEKEASLGHPVIEEVTHSRTASQAATKIEPRAVTKVEPPPAPRSKAPMIVAGILAVAALTAVLLFGRPSAEPAPAPLPVATLAAAPAPEPTQPPPPPPQQEVTLTITSEPSGATVSIADQPAGVTPLQWKTPRSDAAVAVKLSLRGFKDVVQTITPTADGRVDALLERRPARPRPTTKDDTLKFER